MGILKIIFIIIFFTSGLAGAKIVGSISARHCQQIDFPKMTKINSSDAVKVAVSKVHGHVLSVNLENENGYLVYAVDVVDAHSILQEVNVDAGNEQIISIEKKSKRMASRNK